jgi:hypothetical protein
MKAKVYLLINKEKLRKVLPPSYLQIIPKLSDDELVSCIVFPVDTIINSRNFIHCTKDFEANGKDKVYCFCYSCTEEAKEDLKKKGFIAVERHNFFTSSDKGLSEIRVVISRHNKPRVVS